MTEVCVYRNLRSGLWSVTAVKGSGNRGPLICHVDELVLVDCRAVVKQSRREVIAAGAYREVCAWFVGRIDPVRDGQTDWYGSPLARVTFRPRERDQFFRTDTGDDILEADAIWFAPGGQAWLL